MKKSLTIVPIAARSTVDQVVERIRRVILDEKLSTGERLPGEHELVERLQVSRPVLREGIARLQSLGLVDVRRGSGTFVGGADLVLLGVRHLNNVLSISPRELLIYTELRTAIEVQAVRQAALLATDDDVNELAAILVKLSCSKQSYAELLAIDFQFHRKLIDIAGNPLMKNLIEVIYEFVIVQMTKTTPMPRDNARGRKLHAAIVDAIKDRNADRAELAMRAHMDVVVEILHRNNDLDSDSNRKKSSNSSNRRKTPT